jgi:hypothetical protein
MINIINISTGNISSEISRDLHLLFTTLKGNANEKKTLFIVLERNKYILSELQYNSICLYILEFHNQHLFIKGFGTRLV